MLNVLVNGMCVDLSFVTNVQCKFRCSKFGTKTTENACDCTVLFLGLKRCETVQKCIEFYICSI